MSVGVLGIWPTTVGISEEGDQWKQGGQNIVGKELRRFLIT